MTTPSLRWRSCDGTVAPLGEAPVVNSGFTELGRYTFEKPAGIGWTFRVDDEPLSDAPGDSSCWAWTPGFFAGEVTAELLARDGTPHALFLLDVAPDARKVGREIFDRMVRELWAEDPALVLGTEPATIHAGEHGDTADPWLAFSRLRRYGPEFLRSAVPLRARPRRVLQSRREAVALHRARRVDRHTALAVARSTAAAILRGTSADDEAVPGRQPSCDIRLDVPVTEESLDSPANRAIFALLVALTSRVVSVRRKLESIVAREQRSETETPISPRWPARKRVLDDLETQLKRLLRQTPFTDASHPELTSAGLTAIAADPIYARVWDRGWRALRHGLGGGETAERLWVSPTWGIYERWCYLKLGLMLRATMPRWNWQRFADRWLGGLGDRQAALHWQPTFPSRERGSAGFWSVSRERVPDLVITVKDQEETRFIVLDAKYRASRQNVLDAMTSAHVYQDSLRIGPARPFASLLLVPSGGGAPWLEEMPFQAAQRVGIHPFAPGDHLTLPPLLREWMLSSA